MPEPASVEPPASVPAPDATRAPWRTEWRPLAREWAVEALRSQDAMTDHSRHGADGTMHVSQILRGCPRELFLTAIEGATLHRPPPRGADRIMWRIGRAVEAHIRDSIIAHLGADRVIGLWRCACGRSVRERADTASDGGAACCMQPHLTYEELPLSSVAGLVGHPDLVVWSAREEMEVIEIKSKAVTGFNALTAPEPAHILQVLTYATLLRQVEGTVVGSIRVIYGAKDYAFSGVPYKEFAFRFNDPTLEWAHEFIRARLALAEQIRAALPLTSREQERRLPPRLPACQTPTGSTQARSCSKCVSCFARPSR